MLCMKELKSGSARAGSWPPIKDNRLGSSLVILQTASSNLHLPAHQIKWFTAAAVHYSQCHHDSTLSSQHHFLSAYLRHHPASTQRHFVQLRREINLVSAFHTYFTGSYYLQHQKKKKKTNHTSDSWEFNVVDWGFHPALFYITMLSRYEKGQRVDVGLTGGTSGWKHLRFISAAASKHLSEVLYVYDIILINSIYEVTQILSADIASQTSSSPTPGSSWCEMLNWVYISSLPFSDTPKKRSLQVENQINPGI